MRKATIFIVLAFLLVLCATPVYAVPSLPHAFYGSVTLNGSQAPDGTQVSATVDSGSVITNAQNPTTTVGGSYGVDSPHLLVQGDISNGATITFYVNGVSTGQTATFEAGGGPTEKNLTVTIPTGDGVDVAPPAGPTTVEANLFGGTVEFSIDSEGVIQETIEATSEDGNLTITILEDTIALDKDGDPLDSLEAAIDESPPSPPEGANIIGLAYDFGPDGATFDPPITLKYTYDPAEVPEGVAEEDLVIAYYDEDAGEWVECECTCDPGTHCITASVTHFTTFATIAPAPPVAFSLSNLIVQPAEVQPKEAVTITVSVANTGGREGRHTVVLKINGVKEAEKRVTVAAGTSQSVDFSVTREDAGTYSVVVDGLSGVFTVVAPVIAPPPPAPVPPPPAPPPAPSAPVIAPPPAPAPPPPAPAPPNWPLIGAIIVATIVVGLLIFFLIRRRTA